MMTVSEEFVPAQAGSWRVIDLKLASHEAAHATIAILHGLTVREVRIDRQGVDDGGICRVVPDTDRLRCHLEALMAGPICGGTPLRWKPHGAPGSDGDAAALLVDRLGMDEAAWDEEHAAVVELMKMNKRVISAVGGALLEHGLSTDPTCTESCQRR